ncbi:3-keto-5-aminohexanoate cleavage protein [Antarcticimicrobium luteum]|uniref:3-keto-5-aminohexanoate cleavage protein n=1 Tax=Antarcticimicrobium luteum TaxID=2547397 RepID=A0A4R5UYR0_9RHOB|nr:3-keto-5-aminohexanoate cleavage protein [Antarcticimicrobium luteum]TDK44489.1 3-keto-5-aminohexanoate cleavage protein [Antarcticimicrobium luteum]
MTRPLIMVAPNGARRGKADHPALPVTIAETVETAAACLAAGAAALHLHIRDDAGRHSLDPGRYGEALAELARAVPDMRVQITTESAGIFEVPDQLDCLARLKPGWASVSVREIARAPELAARVYGTCADNGTEVQHILYDPEDAALLARWQAQGIVRPGQDSTILVLGRYATGQKATPDDLAPLLAAKPPGRWMLCAFGPAEHACLLQAARRGGDLRVGFENNLHRADGTLLHDNAESVAHLVDELKRIAV